MTKRLYEEMIAALRLWVEYQNGPTYDAYTKAMNATYSVLEKLRGTP